MPIASIIAFTKVPIYIYTKDIEESALNQAIEVANKMPVFHHLALMPDVHTGYGLPIGGVMAMENAISPHAVGYDIGCGMYAVKTNLKDIDIVTLKAIFHNIRQAIPVGFNHRKERVEWEGFDDALEFTTSPVVQEQIDPARNQLGTLGGGNHFIEFQKGDDGYIWFMIHSGSRNLGHKICTYYDKLAKTEGHAPIKDLAYFDLDSELGTEYFWAMDFALKFAHQNRVVMGDIIINILEQLNMFSVLDTINIHHNYATSEKHFFFHETDMDNDEKMEASEGSDVIVHRKGATLAEQGTVGIIPGSQGTASYIVTGLGNAESFNSCSHGAGRVMSRKKAKEQLDADEVAKSMADNDILWDKNRSSLDEAPQAYKDIDTVIANQSDLVKPVVRLMPYKIAAIKG